MTAATPGGLRRFAVDKELTIVTAAEHRDRLLAVLAGATGISVDLSHVADIDTAGLQVLILARDEGARLGMPVAFAGPSAAVTEVLALTSLEL